MRGVLDLEKLEQLSVALDKINLDELKNTLAIANTVIFAEHKMLSAQEVATLCGGVSKEQVDMWRECGILRGTKTGRSWVFSQEEVQEFQRRFRGCNIANPAAIRKVLETERELTDQHSTAPKHILNTALL